jgi:hypothetical protein
MDRRKPSRVSRYHDELRLSGARRPVRYVGRIGAIPGRGRLAAGSSASLVLASGSPIGSER